MREKINVMMANPAGNGTILVLTPVPRERYAEVAGKLLQIDFRKCAGASGSGSPFAPGTFTEEVYRKEIKGEQVGFVLEDLRDPESGKMVAGIEMSGMEFCGNAFRAFAYWKAMGARPPLREVTGRMSGYDGILTAQIDPERAEARVSMPLPVSVTPYESHEAEGVLVDLGGIAHLILKDREPSGELFGSIRKQFERFPAFGVMFLDTKRETMTPVVYVRDTGTTYFEGSCASGTTAAAAVRALESPDGTYRYSFRQPAGTLEAQVTKEAGEVRKIWLSGRVEVSDIIEVEL